MIEIAGIAVSGISLINDLFNTHHNLTSWKEVDLPVDSDWLHVAISNGMVPEGEYAWSKEKHVPTRELRGTHQVVVAYNEEKKTKYRIVQGPADDRVILTKIQAPAQS